FKYQKWDVRTSQKRGVVTIQFGVEQMCLFAAHLLSFFSAVPLCLVGVFLQAQQPVLPHFPNVFDMSRTGIDCGLL
ncbi:MAG: hypothetical protein QM235_14715, partial [Pseudomonadota bacterium]|nr:hypothetical protein [Pseudomonadota bacterium]